jgi:hypothetical protein
MTKTAVGSEVPALDQKTQRLFGSAEQWRFAPTFLMFSGIS